MKKVLTLFFFIACCFTSLAQKKIPVFDPEMLHEFHLMFLPTTGEKIKLKGIKEIKWVDRRLDSFAIGLGLYRGPKSIVGYRLLPAMGFDNGLKRITDEICEIDPDGQYTAIFCVQNLWLNRSGDMEPEKESENSLYVNDKLLLTTECYLTNGENFFAAFRIDSTYKLSKQIRRTNPYGKVADGLSIAFSSSAIRQKHLTSTNAEAFEYCINRLATVNAGTLVSSRRPLDMVAINKYYSDRTQRKIFSSAEMKPGIFRTYADWENATPDTMPFKLNKEKVTHFVDVQRPSGRWEVERGIWGFYDGQNLFIKSGDMYFQVVRIQNNFFYWGSLEVSRFAADDLLSSLPIAIYRHEYRPLKLDMLTGKLRD